MSKERETRVAFLTALENALDVVPEQQRNMLGEALENFASARGERRYKKIIRRSPILNSIMDAIEEISDARLFINDNDEDLSGVGHA